MTGEEMERAIEFLLNSQAKSEARLEQTSERLDRTIEQVNQTNRQLEKLTIRVENLSATVENLSVTVENLSVQLGTVIETQNEFMQVVSQHIVAQGEINASVRDSMRSLNTAMERHFIEGHNGKA